MEIKYPKRFKVEGNGEFGAIDGIIYDNWEECRFNIDDDKFKKMVHAVGLDFGLKLAQVKLGELINVRCT